MPDTHLLLLLTIATIVGIGIPIVAIARARETKKSREKLLDFMVKEGLSSKDDDGSYLNLIHKFKVFHKDNHSHHIRNIKRGPCDGGTMIILDYFHNTMPSNQGEYLNTQTVAYFKSEKLKVAKFYLGPETIVDKTKKLFGYDDINFEIYPKFSGKYTLLGEDRAGVKKIFTRKLIRFFEKIPALTVEGDHNEMLVYRKGASYIVTDDEAPVNEFCEFVIKAKSVFNNFISLAG